MAEPLGTPDLEARIEIAAPPERVWDLVADVTRTPEYSPVVRRIEWSDGPAEPVVGARFRGHNRFNGFRWSRQCEVTEAEPGRRFAFSTHGKDGQEQTRWRYEFEPVDGGATQVTLAYEIVSLPRWVRWARRMPGGRSTNDRQARWNVDESLRRIRGVVERA